MTVARTPGHGPLTGVRVVELAGVGPGTCHARDPGLVHGRTTGRGQQGPLARRAGHDLAYTALTGTLGTLGTFDWGIPGLLSDASSNDSLPNDSSPNDASSQDTD
jgi:crotonobetainyl-CoA:carnitine CoA-transferase CaiB-like acyl-CoA transferase